MAQARDLGEFVGQTIHDAAARPYRDALREIRHVVEQRREGVTTTLQAETRILALIRRTLGEDR